MVEALVILHGDCIEQMAVMPDASVHAIVTDPPYGIGFMGHEWDQPGDHAPVGANGEPVPVQGGKRRRSQPSAASGAGHARDRAKFGGPTGQDNTTHSARGGAMHAGRYDLSLTANQRFQSWCESWAREALRILKPGGYLLASCGTRTYHRMAAGIEDAGFEIRDSLLWLYGSGFPKSHDVSKAIDRAADYRLQATVRRAAVAAVEAVGLELPGNSRHDWTVGEHAPGDKWWAVFQEWLPTLSDEDRQRIEGEVVAKVKKAAGWFTSRDLYSVTAPATPEAAQWQGWGTALKPAHEPIVVARKPPVGTVAENVLEHGTGALNIDGCRVEGRPRATGTVNPHAESGVNGIYGSDGRMDRQQRYDENLPAGRWPANVVLSHTPLCEPVGTKIVRPANGSGRASAESGGLSGVFGEGSAEDMSGGYGAEEVVEWDCAPGCPVAALDAQSGRLQSGLIRAGSKRDGLGYHGALGNTVANDSYGDAGGASRFFYCAKTSRAERNAGLEGANVHPTVKPIDLMRWLVRLVTPPGGKVLDPFLGSGSTGCAAVLEGFEFVGIEREADYIAIAEARIAWWAEHRGRGAEEVLADHGRSERERKAHEAAGQIGMDL